MSQESFICETCGERHEGLPTDYGFRLPDEVHALSYLDRYSRSRHNSDLCALDERRYFLRGVLRVPMPETREEFGWGVWVEVSAKDHDFYLQNFYEAVADAPRFPGTLANALPGYEQALGQRVEVQLGGADQRPWVYFPPTSVHALAIEQREGISRKRHHTILEATGFFDRQGEGV